MFEYKSNVKQVIDNIKLKTLLPANVDNLMLTLATTTLASNLRRIHIDGKNVFLQRIGSYSIKPFYLNPKNSPKKFSPQGKPYERIKKFKKIKGARKRKKAEYVTITPKGMVNGEQRKTRYFDDGYYGFRRLIGADFSNVNLSLSGGLQKSYRIEKTPYGYIIGFINSKYSEIADGLQTHFGKGASTPIWGMTKGDEENVKKIVKEYLKTNI